jgi:Na+-transporting NADH:ubiquinone oxidoreductase subunit A
LHIRLSKGLNIPITGAPEPVIEQGTAVRSVAVLGGDYIGLKPKMLVEVGDRVDLGQPLFIDKRDPDVMYTAPGTGSIRAINRGARRALQSVVIELDEAAEKTPVSPEPAGGKPDALSPEQVRARLFTSGLWTAFRTRPFSKVPQSDSTPRSIFVTAIDTQPLAGNPDVVIAANEDAFKSGLRIVARLTPGAVFLCTGPETSAQIDEDDRIRHARFSGPHPAGLPGTHIHHLDPVGAGRVVWHIGYQDVIAIGKLFSEGRIPVERAVALGGEGFAHPRIVTTRLGANIDELVEGETRLESGAPQRLISGSVLSGRTAAGAEAFLGRYHLQVSAIDDMSERELFGWFGLFDGHYSFASRVARRQRQLSLREFSTAQFGRPTAMVPVDAFERVIPMDILPIPLLRSLLVGDTDQAQALGCLELDVEDLALCSFVCPGKNDYGAALNINLDQIEREG